MALQRVRGVSGADVSEEAHVRQQSARCAALAGGGIAWYAEARDAVLPVCVLGTASRESAGVAERYTRRSQKPLPARACGFESHHRHSV